MSVNIHKTHSKLGIAATILPILIWIYWIILAILFTRTTVFAKTFDFILQGDSGIGAFGFFLIAMFFLFIFVPMLGHSLGIIWAIVGCFSKTKKRIFAVIGLVLNILPFFLGIFFYILGTFKDYSK